MKYGLIYTCKLGWIDLGHAIPDNANILWNKILNETGEKSRNGKGYKVSHYQEMRKWILSKRFEKDYYIKLGLNKEQKESVALSIFKEISIGFEDMQGDFLLESSFSGEDLISDLIGFYRALRPDKDYIALSQPVSKAAALQIWDKFGSVGQNKNRSFGVPLYPCSECQISPQGPAKSPLPGWLDTIKSTTKGNLFRDWDRLMDTQINLKMFKF
jgi:hypothetical protein